MDAQQLRDRRAARVAERNEARRPLIEHRRAWLAVIEQELEQGRIDQAGAAVWGQAVLITYQQANHEVEVQYPLID